MPETKETPTDNLDQMSTFQLVRRAVDEARELARAEVALAKQDLRRELVGTVHGVRDAAIAYTCLVLAIASTVIALAVGTGHTAGLVIAIVCAGGFLLVACIAAALGYSAVPKKPLGPTRDRITDDVNELKEHVA